MELTRTEWLEKREEIMTRLTEHAQEIKSLKHRMDKVENMTDELRDMNRNLAIMLEKMDEHKKTLDCQDQRITKLEDVPGRRYDKVIDTIIAAIIGGCIGIIIAQIQL